MKTLLIVICSVLFISCKKDNPAPVKPYIVDGKFSFQLNGSTTDAYGHFTKGETTTCRLINISGVNYLKIAGNRVPDNIPEVIFEAYIKMPSSTISIGNYSSKSTGNHVTYQTQYDSRCHCYDVYNSDETTVSEILFTIESYDVTTKEVICSYSGTLLKEGKPIANITFGKISGHLP
jgi:hypothetical protein